MPSIGEIRKSAAKEVIEDLQSAFSKIQEQEELRLTLEGMRKDVRRLLNNLSASLDSVRNYANNEFGGKPPVNMTTSLSLAETNLGELRTAIDEARNIASKLITFQIDGKKLQENKERLCDTGKAALRRRVPPDPWVMLNELQAIWGEGLDFMGGLGLRHEGLDNGLCQIADALMVEGAYGVNAITIPGRGGRGSVTQTVHLRFPEWTIWALPLIAHEVWHLRLRNGRNDNGLSESDAILESILEQCSPKTAEELRSASVDTWRDPDFQCCLADVFATFVMGPAYACAAILLLLNPQDDKDKQRALAIFKALETEEELSTLRKNLEAQWRQIAETPGVLRYAHWIEPQIEYLKKTAVSHFDIDRWKAIRGPWVSSLLAGKEVPVDDVPMRYVLNAAWKARVDDPAKMSTIATAAMRVCITMLKRATVRPQPSRWPSFS